MQELTARIFFTLVEVGMLTDSDH